MSIDELEAALAKLDEYALEMKRLEMAVGQAWRKLNQQTAKVAEMLDRLRDKQDPADWWKQ
jgi:hypothetical protein